MKYLLDDEVYEETKEIALGKVEKNPVLAELSEWFLSTYSVHVLNFQFGKPDRSKTKGYRLYVILETTEDFQKMFHSPLQLNEEYAAQICAEFKRIARKHQFATKAQLKDMWVRYNDFSVEARTDVNRRVIKAAKTRILKIHPEVWSVVGDGLAGAVVFYYTDKDVVDNQNSGVSKTIAEGYYSLLKEYDELDVFTRENMNLKFDSKENLDKNYEGNLYYYFH